MIDRRICSGKRRTRNMGSSLDLENVIRHLPDRDTFLGTMYTSHGVPVKASANCCGEYLAIAIAQRQLAKSLR